MNTNRNEITNNMMKVRSANHLRKYILYNKLVRVSMSISAGTLSIGLIGIALSTLSNNHTISGTNEAMLLASSIIGMIGVLSVVVVIWFNKQADKQWKISSNLNNNYTNYKL